MQVKGKKYQMEKNGRIRLTVHGNYNENAPEGTDFRALVDGYISVGKVNNLR